MQDKAGRGYARLSRLKTGDMVEVDGGFTCLCPGEVCVVRSAEDDELYISCSGHGDFKNRSRHKRRSEQHFLAGQVGDDGDSLIGIYPVIPVKMVRVA